MYVSNEGWQMGAGKRAELCTGKTLGQHEEGR